MSTVSFSELQIGDYSALREFQRDREFFLNSFLPPNSFSMKSLRNNNNFVLVGRKGTGKSSCCLALSVEMEEKGYDSTFYNFSEDLTRSDLQDSVRTQVIDLRDLSTSKLFDSIVEMYDFRDIWKRRVLFSLAEALQAKGASSEFVKFMKSVVLAESSIAQGVGKGLEVPLPEQAVQIFNQFKKIKYTKATMPLKDYVSTALALLCEYHSETKFFFFFDELNISHSKSVSDECETLIALVRVRMH
jgi:hypothetical protein